MLSLSMRKPLCVKIAIGCLAFNTIALVATMAVVCLTNAREGIWNTIPIAFLCYLILGMIQRWRYARVLARTVSTIVAATCSLLWAPVMALGMSFGTYQFRLVLVACVFSGCYSNLLFLGHINCLRAIGGM